MPHMPLPNAAMRCPIACLAVAAMLLTAAPPVAGAQEPDLVVEIVGPRIADAGSDIGEHIRITVANVGRGLARGTESAGRDGYMVDVFLTRAAIPAGFASFSPNYSDGVLLRGGRVSNTVDLRFGERHDYRAGGGIPGDTPPGRYRVCARVDAGGRVAESEEGNNVSCSGLEIGNIELVPSKETHASPGQSQRRVLADGTIEVQYLDGTIRRLLPDGSVETRLPDGSISEPMVLRAQVSRAHLPELPPALAGWGKTLGDSLLGIIRNLLREEAEFGEYMQMEERNSQSYYDKLDIRLRSIAFLTRPR